MIDAQEAGARLVRALVGQSLPREGETLEWVSAEIMNATALTLSAGWGRLKPNERAVLEARFGEGQTYTYIAVKEGITRERVRQIEAKALRKMRRLIVGKQGLIRAATKIVVVPDGPLDPNWLTVKQARYHTGLSEAQLRHLIRTDRVASRLMPGRRVQIFKGSLRNYVRSPAIRGRKKGIWRE